MISEIPVVVGTPGTPLSKGEARNTFGRNNSRKKDTIVKKKFDDEYKNKDEEENKQGKTCKIICFGTL